jgi:hypothetical protein
MPSQLQRRFERLLDPSVARTINALSGVPVNVDVPAAPTAAQLVDLTTEPARNTRAHWGDGTFGLRMHDIQSVTVHGTSGWPSYASADNFRVVFDSTTAYDVVDNPPPRHWHSKRAIGPQYFVEPNGTVYVLIGPENLEGDAQFTWHSNIMSFVSLGIEQADGGDERAVSTTAAAFRRLDPAATAATSDLTGMQVFGLLHPGATEDLNLIWFAMFPAYTGPGDTGRIATRYSGWRNTLFTERNYRAMALLCRFLAERNGIPRNFPLLPYASVAHDAADPVVFRKLLLADPLADQIGAKLVVDMAVARAGGQAFANIHAPKHAEWWQRFFGLTVGGGRSTPCFRGFISHMINGGHPCPGPLFDWHRFAREVWDWWWYPFDFDGGVVTLPPKPLDTSVRPYRRARGDTPLVEYYYDAVGSDDDYNALRPPLSVVDRFTLEANVPIYALANGVAIAAKLPLGSNLASPGFLLTRHEVFHQSAAFQGARIDYDQPPTYVWSLISFVEAPGFSVTQLSDANPDWLNRFVIRLKETELAVAFHTANPALTALTRGWAHQPAAPTPPSAVVRRPSTGTTIERDAAAYRPIANDLIAGKPVLFPLSDDPNVTPVTILLGDYLGTGATLPGGAFGVQVEIFSIDPLGIPGAARRAVSAVNESWWNLASAPTRLLQVSATDLPKDGMVWQYSMTDFLRWVNGVTWASEWPKYGATIAGNPAPLPARPNSRIV